MIFFYIFLIFANYLQKVIPSVNFFDEVLALFGLYYIWVSHRRFNNKSPEKKILLFLLLLLSIGTISTIVYQIQPQFSGVWRDFLAISKYPICYYAFLLYSRNNDKDKLLLKTVFLARLFVVTFFILGIINFFLFVPSLTGDIRYGYPCFDGGFSHITFFVAATCCSMSTLIASGLRRNLSYIALGAGCLLLTFRSKPIMGIAFLILAYFVRKKKSPDKFSRKQIALYIFLLCVLTFCAAYDQITSYIGWGEGAARGACYVVGYDIANSKFPLGSGFCTFASSLSGKYYSPLWYDYGLDKMEGLEEIKPSYTGDTFWPNIYSQYGWLGLFFYLAMLYFVFKSINRRFEILSDKWIASMFLVLYSIAAAFAEAFYTNDTGVIFAIFMALYLGNDNRILMHNSRKK